MNMGPTGTCQMYGRSKDQTLGGIFAKPANAGPSAWLIYLRVDSVNGQVDLVKNLGGQVVNDPMDVPGGDRVLQCVDPQGAAYALHPTASAA